MTKIWPGAVVVGVDGSPHSEAAVGWAASYAAGSHRPLVLLNASSGLDPGDVFSPPAEVRHERRILARRVTDAALASALRVSPGLRVSTVTSTEDPRQALVALSDQASMIVVGTRGRGPVASLLIGSVSVTVAAHARCAVAVVRHRDRSVNGVLAGVSADGSDQAALGLAAELASSRCCALDVIHAVPAADLLLDQASQVARTELVSRHDRALSGALSGVGEKYPDLPVNRHLVASGAVRALVEGSRNAECVVVGSRGRTSTIALIGSVGRAVVEHAHSTVVVARG